MNKLILGSAILMALAPGSPTQAQEPANPVAFELSCTMPATQSACSAEVSLPAGKRLVIEQVSARVNAPSGQTIQVYVQTNSNSLSGGTTQARHFIALTPTNSGIFYFANQQFRMYSVTGSNVSIHGQRIVSPGGAPGTVQNIVYFSGYLLP
jgi:hypothetical protein